jgi:hypothetical protein
VCAAPSKGAAEQHIREQWCHAKFSAVFVLPNLTLAAHIYTIIPKKYHCTLNQWFF